MKKLISLLTLAIPSFAFSHSSELHTSSDFLSGHFFTEIDHIAMTAIGFVALYVVTKRIYKKVKSDK